MRSKLGYIAVVVLMLGSTAFAAGNGTATHRHGAAQPRPPDYRLAPAPADIPGRPIYSLGTWGGVEFYSKPGSSSLDPCGRAGN
jgi:hypothetical protein